MIKKKYLYGEIDADMIYKYICKSSILLYDLEKNDVKKIYIKNDNSGFLNTYMSNVEFTNSTFTN
jgi:hypothetical protein